MTVQEFSNEFDILYNNIMSNQAPGLDEYEKSVFLTKAQDEIVRRYFSPKENKTQEGFDDSAKRQIDFSTITKVATIDQSDSAIFDTHSNSVSVDLSSYKIMMILNEFTQVTRDSSPVELITIPVSYIEYIRLMSKPYKRPIKSQAWRLINNSTTNQADIIIGPNDTFVQYKIRYIEHPSPIILTPLTGGLTINGDTTQATCTLDPILHQEILQRAVELAKAAYTGSLEDTAALGQISQTNLGYVTSGK